MKHQAPAVNQLSLATLLCSNRQLKCEKEKLAEYFKTIVCQVKTVCKVRLNKHKHATGMLYPFNSELDVLLSIS